MPPIDPTFNNDTEKRILALEDAMEQIYLLLQNCVGREQINRLDIIAQKVRAGLDTRVTTLETQVTQLLQLYDELLCPLTSSMS